MRWQYRCPVEGCGNTVPAERLERRAQGTRGPVRVISPVLCESRAHPGQAPEMEREEFTPARREVRAD